VFARPAGWLLLLTCVLGALLLLTGTWNGMGCFSSPEFYGCATHHHPEFRLPLLVMTATTRMVKTTARRVLCRQRRRGSLSIIIIHHHR